MFERPLSIVVVLVVLSVSGCSQTSSTQTNTKPANTSPSQPAVPTNSKITINQDAMGTTNDPGQLSTLLRRVFKERHERHAFKPGTIDVETTVYLRADPDVGINEVTKMIDVIREAGSLDVLIPVKSPDNPSAFPNPLTLVVSIGESKPGLEPLVKGVRLIHGPTVTHSDKDSLPKEFLVVTVPKDGEYLVDDKPFTQATLVNELKPRVNQLEKRTVFVQLDADNGVRYRSLADVAQAAFDSGATELYIITLSDKQNPN
jgi:biopolymer transport protein ExbD